MRALALLLLLPALALAQAPVTSVTAAPTSGAACVPGDEGRVWVVKGTGARWCCSTTWALCNDAATASAAPWTGVTGKPATFPPSTHTHAGADVTSAVASATALAADPADCTGDAFAKGIAANGTAACFTPAFATQATWLKAQDTRSTNAAPQDFGTNLYADFKTNTTDGLNDGGTFHGVLTLRPYGSGADFSGGPAYQVGFAQNGNLWLRLSTAATTWGAWSKLWDDGNDGAGSGLDADTLDGSHASAFAASSHTHAAYAPLSGAAFTSSITVSGDITASGNVTAYGSVSDLRLKRNVQPIRDALGKTLRLRGVTHEWREEKLEAAGFEPTRGSVHGLIAQDVRAVMPDAVYEAKGKDGTTYLGVRYERMVPLLIEAIRELEARVAALERARGCAELEPHFEDVMLPIGPSGRAP